MVQKQICIARFAPVEVYDKNQTIVLRGSGRMEMRRVDTVDLLFTLVLNKSTVLTSKIIQRHQSKLIDLRLNYKAS